MLLPNSISELTKSQGLHFYREHFPWGSSPAFRNNAGTVYRFYVHDLGKLLTPAEMLADLQQRWEPPTLDEASYKHNVMPHEFGKLPNA